MLQSGKFVNIDVDNETNQLIDAGTDNLSSENEPDHNATINPPTVGIVFQKWEDIDIYYRQYGEQQGFGVVRPSSRFREKNKDQRRSITWTYFTDAVGHCNLVPQEKYHLGIMKWVFQGLVGGEPDNTGFGLGVSYGVMAEVGFMVLCTDKQEHCPVVSAIS
uniref:Uncharacterized protein n=1 Tax=Chenopodium quinoa TaxID=63459 RepID=A0A803LFU1_CHEQI